MYSTLCRVEADTSRLSIPPKISKHQRMQYYEIKFEILLSLGLTELKAHICWQENVSFLLVTLLVAFIVPILIFSLVQGIEKRQVFTFYFQW